MPSAQPGNGEFGQSNDEELQESHKVGDLLISSRTADSVSQRFGPERQFSHFVCIAKKLSCTQTNSNVPDQLPGFFAPKTALLF